MTRSRIENTPLKSFLFTVLLLLALAPAAQAAELYTAPFWGGSPGDDVTCKLANIGTAPQTVQIRMYNASGAILQDSGPSTVNAGNVLAWGDLSGGSSVYCRFTVSSKAKSRGTGTFAPGPSFIDVFAVPAQ